tara:strand:- start:61 stop:462 length:402 start_codon:yes stop_codon:yes gene_type:complete
MPNYSKCVIYTITTPNGLYVGSTCNYTRRKWGHKSNIHNQNKKTYNYKLYKNIRENGDEWIMKPHSEFPCESKMQMNIEEERIRRELNANLNCNSCYGFDIEKNKQYHKKWSDSNKEKIKEYKKEWYQANKNK